MKTQNLSKVAGLVVLMGASVAAHASILNGSFENGSGANADNWIRFGNAYREPVSPLTGDHSMKMFGNFSGGFNVTGAFQDFAISPGQSASASVYARNWSADPMQAGNWALMKLIYRDAGNNDLVAIESAQINVSTPLDAWQQLTAALGPAPAGTHHGSLFLLFLQPEQNFNGGSTFFDDASVQVVPEPASMLLMAAGLAITARRRRSSK